MGCLASASFYVACGIQAQLEPVTLSIHKIVIKVVSPALECRSQILAWCEEGKGSPKRSLAAGAWGAESCDAPGLAWPSFPEMRCFAESYLGECLGPWESPLSFLAPCLRML